MHGHDPRFPVNDNWDNLVDELLHHLASLEQPVWGVGHSSAACCTTTRRCAGRNSTAAW